MKLILMLLATASCYAWFVEPSASMVFPENSKANHKGIPGEISYKEGFSFGLNTGKYTGPFKLYLSYDYTQFRAEKAVFESPYGAVEEKIDDLYLSHTIMANIDYIKEFHFFQGFMGVGGGYSIDSTTSTVLEGRAGVRRNIGGFEVSALYSKRWLNGTISGSTQVEIPDQGRLTLMISKKF